MKIVFISSVNSQNLGDIAIYYTQKKLFEDYGHSVSCLPLNDIYANPKLKFTKSRTKQNVFTNKENANYVSKRNLSLFLKRIPIVAKSRMLLHYLFLNRKRKNSWESIIKSSDLVIIGGGALLIDINWGFPLALSTTTSFIKKHNVPYGIIGVSAGEEYSFIGKYLIKSVLKKAKFIWVRDIISFKKLKEFNVVPEGVLIDSAINIRKYITTSKEKKKGITIGINIIAFVKHKNIQKNSYSNYLNELIKLIMSLDKKNDQIQRIILYNTGDISDTYSAQGVFFELSPWLNNISLSCTKKLESLTELIDVINQCDIIIGTRMHSCILAKSYSIPIIGISWDQKIEGFFKLLHLNEYFINFDKVNSDELISRIDMLLVNGCKQKNDIDPLVKKLNMLPLEIKSILKKKN